MKKIGLLLVTLLSLSSIACASQNNSPSLPTKPVAKEYARGLPVYIQVFKEEGVLELYTQSQGRFQLLDQYKICKYSGGLGPKQRQGDLKSPEGFYQATLRSLKPNSRFYKAINIGYPNSYDLAHGYTGNYLMIHGKCSSTGCYAMTNDYIEEIYGFVEAALKSGQPTVPITIYPFRMTEQNMQRHRNSEHTTFWQQLKPGYDYFVQHAAPPQVEVIDRRYVLQRPLFNQAPTSEYALSQSK